jgi:NadR type nicotinamide-nucleotide adenylyltransferase
VFGPESTGKSTLAKTLGAAFNTVVVPEYGRTHTEAFGSDVTAEDLRHIVQGHLASVVAAKRQANKVLIEDTDPVMTAVWSDMLLDKRDSWFDSFTDYADLYLLCDVDIPWVDDGTRYFSNDLDRKRFFDICEQELKNRNIQYIKISGDFDTREQTAIEAVKRVLMDEIC